LARAPVCIFFVTAMAGYWNLVASCMVAGQVPHAEKTHRKILLASAL
jgi:hypothetical protein